MASTRRKALAAAKHEPRNAEEPDYLAALFIDLEMELPLAIAIPARQPYAKRQLEHWASESQNSR